MSFSSWDNGTAKDSEEGQSLQGTRRQEKGVEGTAYYTEEEGAHVCTLPTSKDFEDSTSSKVRSLKVLSPVLLEFNRLVSDSRVSLLQLGASLTPSR